MAKVITTITAEGIEFDEICSFETENYVGIWCGSLFAYVLMPKEDGEFECSILPVCSNLKELDNAVYNWCEEHIEEVYESSTYEFVLKTDD